MKIGNVCVLMLTACVLTASEAKNLVENPAMEGNRRPWHCNSGNFKSEKADGKSVLVVTGDSKSLENQRIIQLIRGVKAEDLAGKKFLLTFRLKAEKISGSFTVALHEIDRNGKSLKYHTVRLTKYDRHDWKTYRLACPLLPGCASVGIYVTADYLGADDRILLSDLSLVPET